MISYFQEFCGVEFSEKNLSKFATYFERTGHEECIYSIFPKGAIAVELLKKIGFHRDNPEDGPILVMQGFVDEDKEINICPVIKMIYEKKSMCT